MSALECCVWIMVSFLLSAPVGAAQSGGDTAPLKTTMCDLYKDPQRFAGKMVEVRATIAGRREPELEEPSFSPQARCAASGYIIVALEFPQNVKPRPDFDLERDASFEKYEEALTKPTRIEATLEGRFDPVFIWQNRKRVRIGEGQGFGKKHRADARLVLRRMSRVEVRYIARK